MEPADFVTHYFDRSGKQVDPPMSTGDEDADIATWEDFVLRVHQMTYCTVDGTAVHTHADAQSMCCGKGHRWIYVAPVPSVTGSTWGWRQVP